MNLNNLVAIGINQILDIAKNAEIEYQGIPLQVACAQRQITIDREEFGNLILKQLSITSNFRSFECGKTVTFLGTNYEIVNVNVYDNHSRITCNEKL